MKKNYLFYFISLNLLGLAACGNFTKSDLETNQIAQSISEKMAVNNQVKKNVSTAFIHDVGSRFGPIKKETVANALFFDDFFDKGQLEEIETLKSVTIIRVIDDKRSDIREIGYSNKLTDAQLNLLQSLEYANNFLIKADYEKKNPETGVWEENESTPHLTIVPEKQARYMLGKEMLKAYLRVSSEEARVNVDPEKLQPAKLFFTVTTEGAVKNIRLDSPSGYPSLDEAVIQLMKDLPGTWEPAENAKGEMVDQELVVSFGSMGC
ncbi:energy transducer TonB [Patiriisocius sp. Uisw_017]|jgi:hypothetical protein|uniref:energy transducer TonB n=1 Tax=Patiriisocius sp. Uisw_017 TaxID=3230968 RepID=UPI0039ECA6A2